VINVDSLEEGIVIDHIRQGHGYKIFSQLGLDETNAVVLLLRNVPSVKMGKKDLIKIETDLEPDLAVLGLIDPDVTINYIAKGVIARKVKLTLPPFVDGIFECKNPRCITQTEAIENIRFWLYDEENRLYKCEYCDSITGL
jgi:aspartate carbamoyltransferase regulatory subunit